MYSALRCAPKYLYFTVTRNKLYFLPDCVAVLKNRCFSSCNVNHKFYNVCYNPCGSSVQTSTCMFNKTKAANLDSRRSYNQQVEVVSTSEQLDQELDKLDSQVKRTGRLSQNEVEKVLSSIKLTRKVTSYQALMAVRCCGCFIAEMQAEKRTKLTEDLWSTLHELNCPLDVSHYNALLKVYLENEHKFDPIEFLSMMDQQKVEPNKVTYQRLISRYCQEGDINGASKILELMKDKNIPVNEKVFNQLITGHANAHNMEDAKSLLEVMRDSQLSPSSSTYSALACGYAITGDIENVLKTIEDANTAYAQLQDKDILNIIYSLTVNGHAHLIDQVLPKLLLKPGYSHDCINISLELVNRGHHQVGFTLLKSMPRTKVADGSLAPAGMFFIRQTVQENLPVDVIIDYCNKLKEAGINDEALIMATKTALILKKTDDAIALLKELHSQNHILRPHYFWPIFVCKKEINDVLDILKLMVDLDCPGNFETFLEYIFPNISLNDYEKLIKDFESIGYRVQDTVSSLFVYFLVGGDTQAAAKLLEKYPVKVDSRHKNSSLLVSAFTRSQDLSSVAQIVQYIQENVPKSTKAAASDSFCEQFVKDLVLNKSVQDSQLENFLTVLQEMGMKISQSTFDLLAKRLGNRLSSQMSSTLETITAPDRKPSPMVSVSVEELEAELINLKANGEDTKAALHKLLQSYVKEKNTERIKELIKEMDISGYVYHKHTYGMLIEHFCNCEDLDQAMHFRKRLETEYPDYRINDYTTVYLASLLANNKKYDDAEQLIHSQNNKSVERNRRKTKAHNICRLLEQFAYSEDVGHARRLFEMLHAFKYCNVENKLLSPLVKAFLFRNDMTGAVEEFLRLTRTYGVTPFQGQLFKMLIQNEDLGNLQAVIDASTKIHGESNVLFNLISAFIACDRLKEATKIAETPGLRIKPEMIDFICGNYTDQNRITELEAFLLVTKDVFGLNRDGMYYHLIKAYAGEGNVDKALRAWEMMEEENVVASSQTMHLLGTFLQRMNRPVPFAIPEVVVSNLSKNKANLKKVLEMNSVGEVLNMKRSLRFEDGSLTMKDAAKILQVLLENDRLQESLKVCEEMFAAGYYPNRHLAKLLAKALSKVGDESSLLELQDKLPEETRKLIPFKDYLAISHIQSGRTEELMRSLESEVFKYKSNFPGEGLLALLTEKPEMLDRAKRIADLYYQEGLLMPRRIVWTYLMIKKCFEEAGKVFEATPEFQSKLSFGKIIYEAKTQNDIELSEGLVNVVHHKDCKFSSDAKGAIYSCHINILVSLKKFEEAVNTLNEALKTLEWRDLNSDTVLGLKEILSSTGKIDSFVIPEFTRTGGSSSSDSSSSDDDKKR